MQWIFLHRKYKSEDFYGAITDLSECVKLDTSDVEAYMLLADAYVATGKEDEAVSALEIGYREKGSTKIKTRLDALSEKLRVDKIYNNLAGIVHFDIVKGTLSILLVAGGLFIGGLVVEFIRSGIARMIQIPVLSKKIVLWINQLLDKIITVLN